MLLFLETARFFSSVEQEARDKSVPQPDCLQQSLKLISALLHLLPLPEKVVMVSLFSSFAAPCNNARLAAALPKSWFLG